MYIVDKKITLTELKALSEKMYEHLVKSVVDISTGVMVVDAEFHSDQEALLLEHGSDLKNLWGINLYPYNADNKNWIQFDSMINVRPHCGNRSRYIENDVIRNKIITIVNKRVEK